MIFGHTYSGLVCKAVLGEIHIRVDRLRKIDCPLCLSRPQIGLALPRVGGFFLPDCELGQESFPAFGLTLKHRLFLGFKTADFGTRNYTIGSARSQAASLGLELHHQQSWVCSSLTVGLRTSQVCNHVSQNYWFCFSREHY